MKVLVQELAPSSGRRTSAPWRHGKEYDSSIASIQVALALSKLRYMPDGSLVARSGLVSPLAYQIGHCATRPVLDAMRSIDDVGRDRLRARVSYWHARWLGLPNPNSRNPLDVQLKTLRLPTNKTPKTGLRSGGVDMVQVFYELYQNAASPVSIAVERLPKLLCTPDGELLHNSKSSLPAIVESLKITSGDPPLAFENLWTSARDVHLFDAMCLLAPPPKAKTTVEAYFARRVSNAVLGLHTGSTGRLGAAVVGLLVDRHAWVPPAKLGTWSKRYTEKDLRASAAPLCLTDELDADRFAQVSASRTQKADFVENFLKVNSLQLFWVSDAS